MNAMSPPMSLRNTSDVPVCSSCSDPSARLQEPTITLNFVFIVLLLFKIALITHIPKQF